MGVDAGLDPLVVESLLDGDAVAGIFLEEGVEEVAGSQSDLEREHGLELGIE